MQRSPRNQTSLPSRNLSTDVTPEPQDERLPYVIGVLGGALVGLFSAYIFRRGANEDPVGRRPASNGQIFTLIMSSMALIRQIAEMGKQPPKK